jgi:deoxyhypusine synthase
MVLIELAHRNYFDVLVSTGANILPKVQVFCDATIALPLVISALVARGEKRGRWRVP